jgi:uncharacterized protein (TIGR02246 family)
LNLEAVQLRDFGMRYTAAWCSKDPARVAELYSPNGSLTVNHDKPAVGRTAIAEIALAFMAAFPDLVLTMDDVLVQGNHAVYRWTFAGTDCGPGGSGHRVHFSGYEVWQFGADGLIGVSQGHFNETEYQHQLQYGIGATQL